MSWKVKDEVMVAERKLTEDEILFYDLGGKLDAYNYVTEEDGGTYPDEFIATIHGIAVRAGSPEDALELALDEYRLSMAAIQDKLMRNIE